MRFKLIYAVLLSLILAAIGWQWAQFETPLMKKSMLPPALPLHQKLDSSAQLESMLGKNLWHKARGQADEETVIATEKQKLQAISWILKGVGFQQVHAPTAMIAAGSEVKVYHESDVLPGGAILLRILSDGVVVEKNGEERNVYLFKEK